MEQKRMIVGITGASGVVMGYHLLEALAAHPNIETHLVMSECARLTWNIEAARPLADLLDLADHVHDEKNFAAAIASGSFVTDGMIIIPCSMKTLAGIACGYSDNLLLRAADVCLKENRKVVLVPREMPFGKVHIRNLKETADIGCTIVPPMLTFYNAPEALTDQIHHVIGKVLLQFGIRHNAFKSWQGAER